MSVIIVGGGMVGATLALAISQLSHGTLPVHLIEASEPETDRHPGFDARAIALAAGTCQQLARIGVWQAIADCATAIKTVHVSDRGHAGFVTLDAQEYRIPALGQVVELHDVGLRLFALLRKAPILLLDEATSGLDMATERRLLDNLRQSGLLRTCILVTHRPESAKFCGRTYEIRRRQVTEVTNGT